MLPAALVVLVVGLLASLRAPRTDPRRAALLLWGGWLVVAGVVFSFMSGIIHPYYTNILAPPLAVLTGVGAVELWRRRRHAAVRVLLALTLAGTCLLAVHLLGRSPSWHPQLRDAILAAGVLASVMLLVAHRLPRAGLAALAATAALAGLGAPVAYTFATVTGTQSGSIVSAGPAVATRGGGFGGRPGSARPGAGSEAGGGGFPAGSTATGSRPPRGTAPAGAAPASSSGFAGRGGAPGGQGATLSAALTKLLSQSPASYTWVAAAASSQAAAPIELATGKAVMALGGFSGSDPAITLARFKALVAAGKIHYYIASGGGGGAGGPAAAAARSRRSPPGSPTRSAPRRSAARRSTTSPVERRPTETGLAASGDRARRRRCSASATRLEPGGESLAPLRPLGRQDRVQRRVALEALLARDLRGLPAAQDPLELRPEGGDRVA